MDEHRLRAALRGAEIPDAPGAHARARRSVLAAHAARPSGRRGRRRTVAPAMAAAALATLVTGAAVAAGPPVIAGWVGTTLHLTDRVPEHVAPASLVDLPGGGQLLVSTGEGTWLVGRGPARRVAGPADQVGWSAFGNYLVRARGGRLQALSTTGRVAWTQRYPQAISSPTWSPDGNRIAFRLGTAMHVTAGDGTGAHPLTPAGSLRALPASPVASSWRPGPRHQLAVLDSPRRITLIDTDSGEIRWRLRAPRATLSLSWSRDGRLLLAVGTRSRRLYGSAGQLLSVGAAAAGTRYTAGQLSPSGRQVALIRTRIHGRDARRDVVLIPAARLGARLRVLLAGHDLSDLRFSPDGRWLLVGWHRVDSWLFFATADGDRRARLVSAVSRHVGKGEPIVKGWCCTSPKP